MVRIGFAISAFAVLVQLLPVQAQSDSAYELAQDEKACTAKGIGPDNDDFSEYMAQRKVDRFQQAQQRAADLAAMPKALNPLPPDLMYVLPERTFALQHVPQMPKRTMTVTKVCSVEGDATKPQADEDATRPQADADAAKPQADIQAAASSANCQTSVEVQMKEPPRTRMDYRNDPTSPENRTDPGGFMNTQIQDGGQ